MTEPGWYQADGDPAGTNRYWDGELWIGEPVAAAPATTRPGSPGFGVRSKNAP